MEPLRVVCQEFVDCIAEDRRPVADGEAGAQVVEVLEAMTQSLRSAGAPVAIASGATA